MKTVWELKRLGDLCAFDKTQGIHSNLPYVGLEHIESGTGQYLGNLEPTDVKSSTFKFNDSHVLYGRLRPYLNKVLLPDFEGHCSTEIFPIQIKPGLVREYLGHWLMSESVVESINATCTGARMPRADMNKVLEFNIPVPSEQQQRRIVTLLDEAFADIATAKANAEKNLQNTRELFESHLDASFGQRNESWTEKALQDIGSTQTGSTPKTSDQANYGDELPFIKPGDFAPDGTLNYENDGLSAQGAARARQVSANSVLMVCIGATIGKCGYVEREIATNQQINAFTPVAGVDKKFIYYQMLTKRFQDRVIHGSGQATLPIINKSKWSALTIYLPATLGEQVDIAKKLDAIREETQRLESIYHQKLTALDDLKKSLLHQAFSGQF